MNTIGLIGGMSWESTITYYRILNEEASLRLGGLHSARILMYSVDFQELEENMQKGDWNANARILSHAARVLENAGADFIVIATNTMHKLVPKIEKEITIPILHIADATAAAVKRDRYRKVGLLGTRFTMSEDFIKDRLKKAGLEVLIPVSEDMGIVDDIIFRELCLGKILDSSKQQYQRIIGKMRDEGAEAIILGCTEIGMLIGEKDSVLPVYDTTVIHAKEAFSLSLENMKS